VRWLIDECVDAALVALPAHHLATDHLRRERRNAEVVLRSHVVGLVKRSSSGSSRRLHDHDGSMALEGQFDGVPVAGCEVIAFDPELVDAVVAPRKSNIVRRRTDLATPYHHVSSFPPLVTQSRTGVSITCSR